MTLTRRSTNRNLLGNALIIKRETRAINLFLFFCCIYLLLATIVLRYPRRGAKDFLVYFLILFYILLHIEKKITTFV